MLMKMNYFIALVWPFEMCVLCFHDHYFKVNYFTRLLMILLDLCMCLRLDSTITFISKNHFIPISWNIHHILYNWIHHNTNILLLCHLFQSRKIFKIMETSHNFWLGILLQMAWSLPGIDFTSVIRPYYWGHPAPSIV